MSHSDATAASQVVTQRGTKRIFTRTWLSSIGPMARSCNDERASAQQFRHVQRRRRANEAKGDNQSAGCRKQHEEVCVLRTQKLNPISYTIVGSVKPALKIYVVNSIFV